ncbi:MAG TPA: helix-turn-helix domain-containing protein [Methylomirabilota bacterium]|nr:helix-turn-helix domain-containing protein [Methylomirabilota bacterium]
MSRARHEDWQLLELEPGADLAAANRALRYRRSLYQPGALATYNLLEDDERVRMLERIDEAYRRITGCEPPPDRSSQPAEAAAETPAKAPSGPPPDPSLEPGAYLRHQRLARGLSLEQLSAVTKIRSRLLAQLEVENVAELPAAVFVRGHVLQIARALGVDDANRLAAHYLAKVKLD